MDRSQTRDSTLAVGAGTSAWSVGSGAVNPSVLFPEDARESLLVSRSEDSEICRVKLLLASIWSVLNAPPTGRPASYGSASSILMSE